MTDSIWELYNTINSSLNLELINQTINENINKDTINQYNIDDGVDGGVDDDIDGDGDINNEENNINEEKSKIENQKKIKSKSLKEKCEYCEESDFLINDGEMIVCTNCGSINNRIIDYNPEWRFYGSDDNKRNSDPNRCGMPSNQIIGESSLSTSIKGYGFEMYRKLNVWNGLTYKEKSMISILKYL